ncbi:MAG: TIM barrel protein, partial [Spirochaetota bacterium]
MKVKFAAVAVVFGSTADRYVLKGYTPKRSFEEMLNDAAKVEGLEGIELVGGWHLNDRNQEKVVKSILDRGLEVAMLIPEIWASEEWGWGTFTSGNPEIREKAKARIKAAMDLAAKTGCNQVSPWFGHDGYDYIFQADYIKAWDLLVEG